MADLLLALSPSLILGTMSLMLIALGGDDRQRVMGMYIGGFVMAVVATPFLGVHWDARTLLISYVSGLLLGWGLFEQTVCLRVLGVSRTMPISTGAQLVSMSLGGVLLFGEWRQVGSFGFGAAAIVALVLGVWLTSRTEKSAEPAGGSALDWRRGIKLLITSTFGLVVYLLLVQWFGIDGRSALLPQAAGYLTIGLVLSAPRLTPWVGPTETRWSVGTAKQVLTGMVWGCAVLILQISAARVGVAAGFTLSQLGVVISTFGGILLLGEKRTRKEMVWTMTGVALLVAGAVLAGVAKSLDG
ncbi:multidrug DMT transporter permease [Schaalia sp. 19OD2882]|uniref:GRP family sugar transporter n=1 Tax=Schaalia sp. 19OD2882 TaxID=2794089 RepID=UPI001C1EB566|nr:GRP family sugar transporter [Schaalia sp. 19OD2882]QWW19220.1 multidrug DMT transporter permease [Schaalia sp. 19OD2882]